MIISKAKVAILLATYNSEKYLAQQIDSILNQSFTEYELYIKDDGSKDQTASIIRGYAKNYSNIHFLDEKTQNKGAMGNFEYLLREIDSEYYMFCDHDDIWLPNKIELSYKHIKELERSFQNQSIIVHTDLKIVDQDLNQIHHSFWEYSGINPKVCTSFKYLSVHNGITGCTMLFNKAAKLQSLPFGQYATMHDAWMSLKVSNNKGKISYIDEPTILYRQHSNNVIGAKNNKSLEYLISKILKPLEIFKYNYVRYKMSNEITYLSGLTYVFYKLKYLFYK